MHQQSKSLLIALAAFAVTTTGVHAYGGAKILDRAGLTEAQKAAIVEAEELKATGNVDAARWRLEDAGIDGSVLRSIDQVRHMAHQEMLAALAKGDFDAFTAAVAGSPLAELITSQADFDDFRAAHELRAAGEFVAAADRFAELGVAHRGDGHMHRGYLMDALTELDETQQQAFLVARQANDRATMQAILDEAGIDRPF